MYWTRRFVAAATVTASAYKTLTYGVLIAGLLAKLYERGRKRLRARSQYYGSLYRAGDSYGPEEGDPERDPRRIRRGLP